jgi:diguanylate cyclase (GGDEF)-like protein
MKKVDGALELRNRAGKNRKARRLRGLNGKGTRLQPAAGATAPVVTGSSAQAAAARAFNRAIIQCQQQFWIAQALIEHLVTRNLRLEKELVQLANREAQARRLAYHDALTGLANRTLLQDRFSQAISQAKRHRKFVAMLLIDLDGFKSINDSLGHATGDKLLCTVAARLVSSIRGADTVCRYGGDEFVIMLPDVEGPAMAAAAAEKIRASLSEPDLVEGYEIRMTASIGSALYPADGKSYEQLMKHADDAMYRAKAGSARASIMALPGGSPADPATNVSGGNKIRGIASGR